MPEKDEPNSLERVEQRLYDPKAPAVFEEPSLSKRTNEPITGWEKLRSSIPAATEHTHLSGPARFFIVACAFFIIAASGAATYLIFGGGSVSTDNITVKVQGPTTISSGDSVPLLITIENHNPVAIRATNLSIQFPSGTKSATDQTQAYPLYAEDLGDIPSGGKVERTVNAVFFGSQGQTLTLPLKIEYHTDGSNSVFLKDQPYAFIVSTSPLSLTTNAPQQTSSGQSVTVDVTVRSNTATTLQNVAVSVEYPFGFVPTATTPKPTSGSLFSLGTLAPGESKNISVTGVLSGQNADVRIFKFTAGTLTASDSPILATSYSTQEADIQLTQPFLQTTLAINNDTSATPTIDPSSPAQVIVSWVNTLSTQVTNGQITIHLAGSALDTGSVVVAGGFYRSSDNTIIFDGTTNAGLSSLQPGESGQGSFSFSTKQGTVLASLRQPAVTFTVSISGQQAGTDNAPHTVSSSMTRTAKVGTSLVLSSRAVHSAGPFKNTGPLPPTPNQKTTYTVIYSLTNTVNSVAGAKVTATLPTYVTYTGQTTPSDGSVSYDDATRTVTWSAGDIPAGTAAPVQAAFQIAFTPSTSQSGSAPILLNAQQVSGVDRFTQGQIAGSLPPLTTQTTSDSGYTAAFGAVQ